MQSSAQTAVPVAIEGATSSPAMWTGRIISALVVLFLAFDGIIKVIKDPRVISASADLGYSTSSIVGIGAVLLGCTLLYVIPRTAILGAILLTGYLGGAVASNVRVGHPVFQCIFPVIFGVLVWAGLFLRDAALRDLVPLRKTRRS
jgi:sorbitol-specific phosphotransferase system component IIC